MYCGGGQPGGGVVGVDVRDEGGGERGCDIFAHCNMSRLT